MSVLVRRSCGLSTVGLLTQADCTRVKRGSLAVPPRLLRLLEETEQFRRWRQKEVAKIVHCGEDW